MLILRKISKCRNAERTKNGMQMQDGRSADDKIKKEGASPCAELGRILLWCRMWFFLELVVEFLQRVKLALEQ